MHCDKKPDHLPERICPDALDPLLKLFRVNSTWQEVSLRGNCRLPYEYKAKLGQLREGLEKSTSTRGLRIN
jgi:hypothetical protein